MKPKLSNSAETAQVLPWLVIGLVAIIAMAALLLDGSGLFLNRREAQAAADAGALAGARLICTGASTEKIEEKAVEYAAQYGITSENISANYNEDTKLITVETTLGHEPWFAGIITSEDLITGATATAGCFGPKGKAVLPLSWYCADMDPYGPYNPEFGCKMQTLSWEDLGPLVDPSWQPISERKTSIEISDYDGNVKNYSLNNKYKYSVTDLDGKPPEQIYIVMDSDKICIEDHPTSTAIVCDIDGDGKKDIQTGGERGWVYLTAKTNNISDWIVSPPTFVVKTHIWLSGKSGGVTDVYKDIINTELVGQVVLVPVFNYLCDGDPREKKYGYCVNEAHISTRPDGDDVFDEIRNKDDNYHIITFQPFYIACVDKKGDCPGFNYANELNDNELKDIPVIEGFFLTDYYPALDITDNCDVNLGNCLVSLTN